MAERNGIALCAIGNKPASDGNVYKVGWIIGSVQNTELTKDRNCPDERTWIKLRQNDAVLNNVEIWNWQDDGVDKDGRFILKGINQFSTVNEIIYLKDYIAYKPQNKEEVRLVLDNGIELPFMPTPNFLLAIDETNEDITVLKIFWKQTKDLKWTINNFDRKNELYFPKQLIIPRDYIISFNISTEYAGQGYQRFFYKYIDSSQLYEAAELYDISTPEEKTISVLQKVKNLFDNKKHYIAARTIIETINSADRMILQEVADSVSAAYESTADERYSAFIETISKTLQSLDNLEAIIKIMIERDPQIYERYKVIADNRWQTENTELQQHLERLKTEVITIEQQRDALANDLPSLKNQANQLRDLIMKLESNIPITLNKINNEVVDYIATSAVLRPFLGINVSGTQKTIGETFQQNRLWIKEPVKINGNISEIDLGGLIDIIQDNLECIGVSDTISGHVAQMVITAWYCGLVPLICGYKTREVATAISAALCGKTPAIITLPMGYTDATELFNKFNIIEANLTLIEDAVGGMAENSLFPLLREWTASLKIQDNEFVKKWLILSTEVPDAVKFMPENLLNYVALISIDDVDIVSEKQLQLGDALEALQNIEKPRDVSTNRKHMREFIVGMGLGEMYALQRGMMLSFMDNWRDNESSLYAIVRLELLIWVKQHDAMDAFYEAVRQAEFSSDNERQLLKGEIDE